MTREAIASVFPWSGFGWARMAQSQSESPLAPLVAWVGTSGMSFLLVWFVAFVIALATRSEFPQTPATPSVSQDSSPAGLASLPHSGIGVASGSRCSGKCGCGLYADYDRGDNLRDHYLVNRELYDEVVDVVVWPENASDIDPLRYPEAAALSQKCRGKWSSRRGGAITKDGDDTYNSVLLWEYDRELGWGRKRPVRQN